MDIKKKISILSSAAFILYIIWMLFVMGSFGIVDSIGEAYETYLVTDDYTEESIAYQIYEDKVDFLRQYSRVQGIVLMVVGLILLFILVLAVAHWRK